MPLVKGSTADDHQVLPRVRPLDGALLPRRRRCGGGSLIDGRGGGGDLGRRRARRRVGVAARAVGSAIATPSPTPTTTTTTTTTTPSPHPNSQCRHLHLNSDGTSVLWCAWRLLGGHEPGVFALYSHEEFPVINCHCTPFFDLQNKTWVV